MRNSDIKKIYSEIGAISTIFLLFCFKQNKVYYLYLEKRPSLRTYLLKTCYPWIGECENRELSGLIVDCKINIFRNKTSLCITKPDLF